MTLDLLGRTPAPGREVRDERVAGEPQFGLDLEVTKSAAMSKCSAELRIERLIAALGQPRTLEHRERKTPRTATALNEAMGLSQRASTQNGKA
jgi:hypothetical protein